MKLLDANTTIQIPGEELARVFLEIELVLISLHKIGAHYATTDTASKNDYEHETTRFIDEWRVTERLALARSIISERFDQTLGSDDMDDLERAAETLKYWENPQTQPPRHRNEET